ncbi:MAG: porphobilinogen synthase [Gammaproteobacteria bacterium]|jgi:porphobilinogen synthase|nr:porphobilinogen synthase [Gammaproteobacteria bacterium]MDP6617321.1 porphobilinogen synthase [Gammaproteobacteria bacterium]MDP6694099.1 porphobilinogen synthase [Gammaproteobacteria bacterium]MDP7041137.1 porphobilinogen synthase [Gammaproteobacteria bacterium]
MAGLSLRRTRLNKAIRELTREVRPVAEQFIQPLFVVESLSDREAVPGLNDVWRDTPDSLIGQIRADLQQGVNKFLLFGVPAEKAADNFDHSFTAAQIARVRHEFGDDVWLAADVCLCSSTTHGHCGIVNDAGDHVINDASVAALAEAALQYARAGADCVAPSDMMDGRVAAIRLLLDNAGLDQALIMSYSAKFHSGFYGPFRVAADSAPGDNIKLTDRASYQIDPARPGDALLSSQRDAEEGADILMVKPGMPYLDVLADLSAQIAKPWAVYQTSGESAGLELLAQAGLAQRDRLNTEAWTAFLRAGAAMIISYDARHARAWLSSE